MADFESLVEDYATEPVPEHATYNGVRIGFVLGGIGVALPGLLSGAEVGHALGYADSALAFLVAGMLVTVLAIVSGWVGMRSRLSTYMILRFPFGETGARLVNLSFAVAQFGWFGVNAHFFGAAAESIGQDVLGLAWPSYVYVIGGGVLMTGATIFGFKALDKIALVVFPLMMATLALMVARTFGEASLADLNLLPGTGEMTFGQAVTVLAGGIIVGVLLVPDLTRYARGPWDVVIAAVIAMGIIEPLVHLASSGPAVLHGGTDPLALMLALGFGGYAMVFLISAAFSTNAVNLYGSGLSLSAIFPRVPEWRFVIAAGVIGTALAVLEISELFIGFLVWQSVIFSSVLGVYVVDFFVVRRGDYDLANLKGAPPIGWPAFAAWAAGAVTAGLTYVGQFRMTGMSNLDGVLVAAALYFLLRRGVAPVALSRAG